MLLLVPLLEWAVMFCKGAEIKLKRDAYDNEIKNLMNKKEKSELVKERNTRILHDIEEEKMVEIHDDKIKMLEANRVAVDDMQHVDQKQARRYQEKLFAFEKDYFKRLADAAKNL